MPPMTAKAEGCRFSVATRKGHEKPISRVREKCARADPRSIDGAGLASALGRSGSLYDLERLICLRSDEQE